MTAVPGARLAVLTADCAPVALASDKGVVGVAHAGWRGLVAGVLERTVEAMRALGADGVQAALGPCIHAECYEFGAADLDVVAARYGDAVRAVTTEGTPALDLPAAVRAALDGAGVELVSGDVACTACSPDHYSFRARSEDERQAGGLAGGPMSAIAERVAEVRGRVGPDIAIVAVTKGFDADVARRRWPPASSTWARTTHSRWWPRLRNCRARGGTSSATSSATRWRPCRPTCICGRASTGPTRWAPGRNVLVQVNLSGLAQRNGCSSEDAPALVDALAAGGLDVQGVMGVAGPGDPRPQFRRLAALASELGLPEVSMGMSGDYEIAVEEGSTMVRLGTALFGPRPDPARLRR